MSLETRIVSLAQAIGADIKTLSAAQGSLSALNTTAKTSLVAAINELVIMIQGAGVKIDDAAGNGSATVTWSADKIFDSIEAAKAAVKNELVSGASAALDTLNELAAALNNDPSFATTIAGEIANRVRFDAAQTLTSPQQVQARANIGAAAAADVANRLRFDAAQTLTSPQQVQARANIGAAAAADVAGLITGLGTYDRDYVATYNTAKE